MYIKLLVVLMTFVCNNGLCLRGNEMTLISKNKINTVNLSLLRFLDKSYQWSSFFSPILLFIVLGYLIWSNSRGFDILDGGFYLLGAKYPNAVELWPNKAHFYTSVMFRLVGGNIITFRLLGEILLLGSSSLFFWGWSQLIWLMFPSISQIPHAKIISWSVISLSSCAYYALFLITPSYNLLNAIGINAATGLLCLGCSCLYASPTKKIMALFSFFLSGMFVGLSLMVKFPTGVLLGVLFVCVIAYWFRSRLGLAALFILTLGIISVILFHCLCFESMSLCWSRFQEGLVFFTKFVDNYTIWSAIYRFLYDMCVLLFYVLRDYLFIYSMLIAAYCFMPKERSHETTKTLTGYFLVMLIVCFGLNSFLLSVTSMVHIATFFAGWILLFILGLFFLFYDEKMVLKSLFVRTDKRALLLCIVFLLLPFVGAIGTANSYRTQFVFFLTPWSGLFLVVLLLLSRYCSNRWIFLTATAVISLVVSYQLIFTGLFSPYRLNTTVLEQTIHTKIGVPGTYLKVDQATSIFLNKMNQIAMECGLSLNDEVLAFYDMPGIVFAIGGKSPVVPWYGGLGDFKKESEYLMSKMKVSRIKRAFILDNSTYINELPDLSKFGIIFPLSYQLCGQVVWPLTGNLVRLWKPIF